MNRWTMTLCASTMAAIVLTGCANSTPRPANQMYDRYSTAALLLIHPQPAERASTMVPPVGKVAVAQVGSAMASATEYGVREAVQIDGAPVAVWKDPDDEGEPGDVHRVLLSPGLYPVDYFNSMSDRFFGERATVLQTYENGKLDDVDAVKAMYKLTKDGELWVMWRSPDDTDIEVQRVDDATSTVTKQRNGDKEFRRELLYTGRSGNQLTLVYREFSDDMARPAFSQQLQYDAAPDAIIGYQGARFKIISATNTEVTYEVISPLTPR